MNQDKDTLDLRELLSLPPRETELEGAFTELIPDIRKAVVDKGYVRPTPIQEKSIRPLLAGRDMLGCAQTGTGKTAAFTLPMLQLLNKDRHSPRKGQPRALILAPTRELAAQIGQSIDAYSRHLPIRHTVIFGGVGQFAQVKALNKGVDILVATPGRLQDLMDQRYIRLDQVEFFVLDEVDRMLDMGFIPDVKRILPKLPRERQSLFYSATMAPKMVELANSMVRNPVRVTIAPNKPAVESIEQKVMFVSRHNKNSLLAEVLDDPEMRKVIVFIQMKHVANRVLHKLEMLGITGTALHGNKSQNARNRALNGFKNGEFRVLVATDVAARGIDIDDITHVINYDLPVESETYVHRIGRTARAGRTGHAISFCTADERGLLQNIERLIKRDIPIDFEHPHHCDVACNAPASSPRNPQRQKRSKKKQQGQRSNEQPRETRQARGKHKNGARNRQNRSGPTAGKSRRNRNKNRSRQGAVA